MPPILCPRGSGTAEVLRAPATGTESWWLASGSPSLGGGDSEVIGDSGILRPLVTGLHGDPAGAAEPEPDCPVAAGVAPVPGAWGAHVLQVHGNLDALFPVHRRTRLDQDRFGLGQVADEDVARRVEQQQARAAGGGEPIVVAAGRVLVFVLAAARVLPVMDRAAEIPV